MAEEKRAHAMMFPFPCSGHINPTLKLAELLHSRGVHVTFVNTEHNHERLLRTGGARLAGRDGFRFESVPDGLDDEDRAAPDKTVRLYLSLRRSCGPPLVDLARRLGEQEGVPPVTCVVLSGLASFVLGVAEELGVPSFVIWGTSAVGFVCTLRLRQLTQRGYTPLKDESYLTNGNRPFLWVVRPGLVAGDRGMEALPADFLAETKGRRFIAEWCAQEQVLRHRAVGGFLTHSGWNSTTESIWAGVPMICAPGFADQYINSRYVCGEWGVGLRLDEQLRREQVVAHIEELMGGGEKGEEMRRSAAEWKALAEAATAPGGSAYENLDKLVEELRLEVPDGGKPAKVTHAR
ncbi:unnamed protein product [Triticum turgidum subsp. durum]|uniref:Glycosyltransferase n=1 Tax=Triticum turgidum subsp. durum TaxID=4567 RepID=A0A9R0ZXF7_TRITD|nr:unnamed protein product [Triticum turgidum subsp. durum]